jgi:hypothetical protein
MMLREFSKLLSSTGPARGLKLATPTQPHSGPIAAFGRSYPVIQTAVYWIGWFGLDWIGLVWIGFYLM